MRGGADGRRAELGPAPSRHLGASPAHGASGIFDAWLFSLWWFVGASGAVWEFGEGGHTHFLLSLTRWVCQCRMSLSVGSESLSSFTGFTTLLIAGDGIKGLERGQAELCPSTSQVYNYAQVEITLLNTESRLA